MLILNLISKILTDNIFIYYKCFLLNYSMQYPLILTTALKKKIMVVTLTVLGERQGKILVWFNIEKVHSVLSHHMCIYI